MGYEVAKAAEHRGAVVLLISGPTNLKPPANVETITTGSAEEMSAAVFDHMKDADIIIKAAAVSDYRPKEAVKQKIKKGEEETLLVLKKNEDILLKLGQNKDSRILVGFAAETENLEKNAKEKLIKKNLDMIVGNLLDGKSSGFGTDTNKVVFFYRNGDKEQLPLMDKDMVAHVLLDRILEIGAQNLNERG
jgi:phosphopantothenoylcysteine decarboxylase/phosphopantothenate--cysteine ligase